MNCRGVQKAPEELGPRKVGWEYQFRRNSKARLLWLVLLLLLQHPAAILAQPNSLCHLTVSRGGFLIGQRNGSIRDIGGGMVSHMVAWLRSARFHVPFVTSLGERVYIWYGMCLTTAVAGPYRIALSAFQLLVSLHRCKGFLNLIRMFEYPIGNPQ